MKKTLCLLVLAACVTPSFLNARVGERLDVIDKRITSSGSGSRFPKTPLSMPGKRTIDTAYNPDLNTIQRPDMVRIPSPEYVIKLMPPSMDTDVTFYLKSDTGGSTGVNVSAFRNWKPDGRDFRSWTKGKKADKDIKGDVAIDADKTVGDEMQKLYEKFTGWELMVFTVNKTSEWELYRRIGNFISQAELDGLLSINGGQRQWKEVKRTEKAESLFDYDYETTDGSLRARVNRAGSNMTWVMFFSAQMGERLQGVVNTNRKQNEEARAAAVRKSLENF